MSSVMDELHGHPCVVTHANVQAKPCIEPKAYAYKRKDMPWNSGQLQLPRQHQALRVQQGLLGAGLGRKLGSSGHIPLRQTHNSAQRHRE